jgi:deoxyribodipyrimidine photo-lyase
MNWQWAAGTGTDSRFNRSYNVVLQARRHDPRGDYVRRYVEELAGLDGAYLHEPWLLPEGERDKLGYPAPIVDQAEARDRMKRVRQARAAHHPLQDHR